MPLLVRYSRVRDTGTEHMYLSTATVFLNELVKLILCLLILYFFIEPDLATMLTNLREGVLGNPAETLKVCVPSLIYMIQNNLYFVALSNLDATTYCITYQLKILTTAMFFVYLLNRRLSKMQIFALVLLMGGVGLVQLSDPVNDAPSSKPSGEGQSKVLGFAAVLSMCLTSGFAGVYFEKVLKGSTMNLWVQNVRLALLGIPLTLLTMLAKDWSAVVEEGRMLGGIDALVATTIVLNAGGGLTVAVVMKYADNILKAYSQSAAILLACGASMGLLGFRPGPEFLGGTGLVILSVYLYARFPPSPPVKPKDQCPPTPPHSPPATTHPTPHAPPLLSLRSQA